MQTAIKLSLIHFGSEFPGGSVNMRTTDKTQGVGELALMIQSEISADNPSGLLQNLIVCADPKKADKFYVIDGDRRLAALRSLSTGKDAALTPDTLVPVTVMKDVTPGTAMATSIAANTYLPPHPIDQFEAFAKCEASGMTPDTIADRFGIKKKLVEQRLALGKLSPKIRQVWRERKINNDAAAAFTLAPDHRTQDRIYESLKKQHSVYPHNIKRALGADNSAVRAYLNFVGAEAYEKAGGKVVKDLFGDDDVVSDQALLAKLVKEKMKPEIARLLKEGGWSFVHELHEIGNEQYLYRELPVKVQQTPAEKKQLKVLYKQHDENEDRAAERKITAEIEAIEQAARLRALTPKDRGKSGCLIGLDDGGALVIKYGMEKPRSPEQSRAAPKSPREKPKKAKKPGELSWAVRQDLSERLTKAAAELVAADSTLGMVLAIAALGNTDSPVRIEAQGFRATNQRNVIMRESQFVTRLSEALAMTSTERGKRLAELIAKTLDLTTRVIDHYQQDISDKSVNALVDVLDPDKMKMALRRQFDPKDFFGRVSTKHAEAALKEMGVEKPTALKKKKEIVGFVADQAKKHGWLPPELLAGKLRKVKPVKAKARATKPAKAKSKPAAKAKPRKALKKAA